MLHLSEPVCSASKWINNQGKVFKKNMFQMIALSEFDLF